MVKELVRGSDGWTGYFTNKHIVNFVMIAKYSLDKMTVLHWYNYVHVFVLLIQYTFHVGINTNNVCMYHRSTDYYNFIIYIDVDIDASLLIELKSNKYLNSFRVTIPYKIANTSEKNCFRGGSNWNSKDCGGRMMHRDVKISNLSRSSELLTTSLKIFFSPRLLMNKM